MLCEFCQNIIPAVHDKYNHQCLTRHHACYKDLFESADNGCRLCQLFRPYVERELRHQVSFEQSYPKGWYGWTGIDPWEERVRSRYEVAGTNGKLLYYDEGSYYILGTLNADRSDKALFREKTKEIAKYNPAKRFELGQGRHWTQNQRLDGNEIFQWLFTSKGQRFGPEQLWVQRQYSSSSTDLFGGQREPSSSFQLTAGSIDLRDCRDVCYKGIDITSLKELALVFPDLWKWRCVSLGTFEFFSLENSISPSTKPWQSILSKPVQARAGMPATFDILNKWLLRCKTDHTRCQENKSTDLGLPLRLIDVGPADGSQSPRLITRKCSSLNADSRYSILSHTWGTCHPEPSSFVQLSSDNIESMQQGIAFDRLARTFQDSVVITRALNLRYIWIDALCIIQDSSEDWMSEKQQITKYYSGSEICIAATASPNPMHGILHPRIIEHEFPRLEGEHENLGVQPFGEDVMSLISYSEWRARRPKISNQPLNSRCWSLQERLFSRRIVHYTEQQMIWQCRTCLLGEDGQVGEDLNAGSDPYKRPFDLHLRRPFREITAANENEHGRTPDMTLMSPVEGHTGVPYSLDEGLDDIGWYRLLEEYSKRSVTYSTDILPSLSPMAREIQRMTKATYLAGMWAMDDQIPLRSLLWRSVTKNIRADNGSPSWAWSSVLGAVDHPSLSLIRFDHPGSRLEKTWLDTTGKPYTSYTQAIIYDHENSQIEIISAYTTLATTDPYGQVQGGELKLTGLVHRYIGADKWDFSAEGGNGLDDYTLTEYLDAEEACNVQWETAKHLLLCVAEFRDESYYPELDANDQIRFIILRCLNNSTNPQRCMRIGTAKLANKDKWGFSGTQAAYSEENGWTRETLVVV